MKIQWIEDVGPDGNPLTEAPDFAGLAGLKLPKKRREELKAWWVSERDAEWGLFIHAETVSKAKTLYIRWNPGIDWPEWINIRAQRRPLLDGLPFTDASGTPRAFDTETGKDYEEPDAWLDYCGCELCKAAKSQRGRR